MGLPSLAEHMLNHIIVTLVLTHAAAAYSSALLPNVFKDDTKLFLLNIALHFSS